MVRFTLPVGVVGEVGVVALADSVCARVLSNSSPPSKSAPSWEIKQGKGHYNG